MPTLLDHLDDQDYDDHPEAPEDHPEGPYFSPLHKAEKILRSGQPLPLYMAASLMERGIDVVGLERDYE